jgi:pyrroline-5-carboxylate reductase
MGSNSWPGATAALFPGEYMSEYELGVIGAGNMAQAIIRGLLAGGFLPASAVVASDPVDDRRGALGKATGVACVPDNRVPAACPRVLLAVKPQVMATILAEIAAAVRADALVISIAAGVTTQALDRGLAGKSRIVRVMPNTPMLVGAGVSAICPGPRATDADLQWARQLFAASGQVVTVDEPMIDAVTAVSGSGPAYFFYLIEAMIQAGVAEDLPTDVATQLAIATCAGSAKLLTETGLPPPELRAKVTSPKGTTQAAIEAMDAAGVKNALVQAIRAAAARSRELGK